MLQEKQTPAFARPGVRIREYEKLKMKTRRQFYVVLAIIIGFTSFSSWYITLVTGLLIERQWIPEAAVYAILAVVAGLYFRGIYLIIHGDYALMRSKIENLNWGIYIEKQYLKQQHETV